MTIYGNITLKAPKTYIFMSYLIFLGHIIHIRKKYVHNQCINKILSEDVVKNVCLVTLPISGSKSPSTPRMKYFQLYSLSSNSLDNSDSNEPPTITLR